MDRENLTDLARDYNSPYPMNAKLIHTSGRTLWAGLKRPYRSYLGIEGANFHG